MTGPRPDVPMFPGNRLLGSARRLQHDQLGVYAEAMRAYGDHVRFRVGPPGLGFLFDAVFRPEGARQVLASRANPYVKRAPAYTEFRSLIGDGLLTAEGDRWRRHRRILQPLFTRKRTASWVPQLVRASEDLVDDWDRAHPDGGVVDLADSSLHLAIQALGRTLFGGDAVEAAAPILRPAVEVMNRHAARRALAPVRVPGSWPTPANRRARRARRELYALVEELVRRRRNQPDGADLLSLLLTAQDPETGDGLDDAAIRDEVVLFLIAGHDTTGTSLALTLYLVGRHPTVQDRIRTEVTRVAGDRPLTADDLDGLPYTRQVVDEALRLYPPGHALIRQAAEDTELMGCPVPRGRIVTVSIWGIHHNPDVWSDPDRFDPDRFASEQASERDRHAHLPFGAGPRTCIGVHLALAELATAVATVVRTHRLEALDVTPSIDTGLTMHPAGPLRCRVTPVT